MQKISFILLACLSLIGKAYSQNLTIKRESWEIQPKIHTVDSKYNLDPAVILLDNRRVEYQDEGKSNLLEFYTLHKLIHINDDKGIEEFNKIYLGFNDKSNLVEVQARTILKNGKVLVLNENDIKDIQDKDGLNYKIFALEGLEKGCEVEFYYTIKKNPSFFGREIIQTQIPTLVSAFEIISPERLVFEQKGFNGSILSQDTSYDTKRYLKSIVKDIPGIEQEKYAANTANLFRIEYKLSYNRSTRPNERIFTWNELAKRIYTAFNTFTDKEKSRVEDLIKQNHWNDLANDSLKIRAVENLIKGKYKIEADLNDENDNKLINVLDKKISGDDGIIKLFCCIYQKMGIDFQIVLTGDRNTFQIDPDFENWANCINTLLYFPVNNKFISPTKFEYRYPWFPPTWGMGPGLFCRNTKIGNFITAVADVQNVDYEDYTKSHQDVNVTMELNTAMDSITMDTRHIFSGSPAVEYRAIINSMNKDQMERFIKGYTKSVVNSENILFSEIVNPEFEKANQNDPLIIHMKTKSGELLENAGDKILIKMGLAIGPQVEMYQEKPRTQPIFFDAAHVEERFIKFTIPAGYHFKNLNDLIKDHQEKENNLVTMQFSSNYELKGNILSVHILERYTKTDFSIAKFKVFQSIINASSDFNKVVLILEKNK